MAATTETVVFDIHDFKVYSLTSDSTSASPSYGAAVDVPGISEVSLEPNLVTAELKGDARVIAKKGRIDRFKVSATYGKLSLDVLDTIMGGSVDSTGSGASEEAAYTLSSPAPLPYFKVEFKIDDLDEGLSTVHVQLFKCQLTGGTLLSQSSDQFGQPKMEVEAIQPDYASSPIVKIRLLEATTNLSS